MGPAAKLPYWATGMLRTPHGLEVPRISTELIGKDRVGAFLSRTSAYRMGYRVEPGLYAVGNPGRGSDVLVTANYKLSFDHLRRELSGMDLWVLVLDTKGINVWCAAGKGSFGTAELVRRIQEAGLRDMLDHKRIIVPQLGAVGVSASQVAKETGFRVHYGPVRAADVRKYIEAGYKAEANMRRVDFTLVDRLVLTPMELNPATKKFLPWIVLPALIIAGLTPQGILFREALRGGLPLIVQGLVAILAGALVTPLLLPVVPFRAFAMKGLVVGVLMTYLTLLWMPMGAYMAAGAYMVFPALASYIALQFTGSTTYTGMSGVRRELRYALPLYGAAGFVGLGLMVIQKLIEWGVI